MRKYCFTLMFCSIAMFVITFTLWAGEVIPGKDIAGGKFGEVYECAFPNSVELDGMLNDFAWTYAPWHTINFDEGTQPATNGNDATCSFAAVADYEWLYVALKVTDDKIVTGEVMGASIWGDDSVEVYIDANDAAAGAYQVDDSQITIGAVNMELGDIDAPELGGTGDGATTGTRAAVIETVKGWAVEAAIPLKNSKWDIKPQDNLTIGFNVHFNDDDDGGDRDHKLIWSLMDVDDRSWEDTTRFADLKFVQLELAVKPDGKLGATWGRIKQR